MSSGALVGYAAIIAGVIYSTYKLITAQDEINNQIKKSYEEYNKQKESV